MNNASDNLSKKSLTPDQLHQRVLQLSEKLGFALCGVTLAAASPRAAQQQAFIQEGRHGEMDYMADHLQIKMDPRQLLPGAHSLIAVADRYPESAGLGNNDSPRGRFARYAWGRDYHKVLKNRLHRLCDTLSEAFPDASFRATTDTAPIHEREFAAEAGLGWIGRHTLMLHPKLGSWLLLGTVLTTLEITPSRVLGYPGMLSAPIDHCGHCRRCIEVCPTQAIEPDGYKMDARRCIAYLTLEHRSAIDPDYHRPIGSWVGGCDMCQEVCPHNKTSLRQLSPIALDYAPRPHIAHGIPLHELMQWQAENRAHAFQGSSLKRVKLPMILRNATIAAANWLIEHPADDQSKHSLRRKNAAQLIWRLRQLMCHTDEMVANTAQEQWQRVRNQRPRG